MNVNVLVIGEGNVVEDAGAVEEVDVMWWHIVVEDDAEEEEEGEGRGRGREDAGGANERTNAGHK